jgi:hypothetical protein
VSARQAQPGGALSEPAAARQGAAELQARLLSAAYASSGGAAYASAGGAPGRASPAVHVHADARGGGAGAGAAHALADLLGPCAPLSIGAAGPGGALGPLQGPFTGLLAVGGGAVALRGLHAPGHGPGGHRASVLGRRKRSDDDGGDGPVIDLTEDAGMHADSPRGHFAAPVARGTPGRTLFTPVDPGFHPHPGHAAAGRTPPGAEGGLCARRRTSSDSPVLSIDLMRFGGGAPAGGGGSGDGNPTLSAGGYAAFHGPHEADTRGAVRQALSRHLSGHASGHSQPEASAEAPEDDADEEATVRGGVFSFFLQYFSLPSSVLAP